MRYRPRPPVAGPAGPAAAGLLELLYRHSGTATLAGQHNQPAHGSAWTRRTASLARATPALWGQDLGFSAPGTLDAADRRLSNVAEAIAWHRRGAVITYTWHAAGPDDDEPTTFRGGLLRDLPPGTFEAVLEPGSELHTRWTSQVDAAAAVLRRLYDAGVPVLWRPYHEMNGTWFWWGGQRPEHLIALWRQLFDRLTHHHGLTNLLWVWSPNAVLDGQDAVPFEPYYPGHDVVDALALDTYGGRFERRHYTALLALAEGRPIGLGEVGELPPADLLDDQPRWAWFLGWPGIEQDPEAVRRLYADPRVVTLERPGGRRTSPSRPVAVPASTVVAEPSGPFLRRDPRPGPGRLLAVVADHRSGGAGESLRCRALIRAFGAALPTDVVAADPTRAALGCAAQCRPCAGDGPFGWSSCRRTLDLLHGIDLTPYRAVLVSSVSMHRYATELRARTGLPLIVDFHNVEADVHESMAAHPRWPGGSAVRPVHGGGPGVARLEQRLAGLADVVTVTSADDRRRLIQRYAPAAPVFVVPNAVDLAGRSIPDRPVRGDRAAFVGHLQYFPNVLAAEAVCERIAPAVRRRIPGLDIVVAGRRPGPHLHELARRHGVRLIADPADTGPIFDGAVLLVPLTLGGGTRLKVLEAFAAGSPVVSTSKGVEGIRADPYEHYLPAEDAEGFAAAVERIRTDPAEDLRRRRAAWELVRDRYSWAALEAPAAAILTGLGRGGGPGGAGFAATAATGPPTARRR